MNIEDVREYCLSLKGATEDLKWESELCFCISGKIFCMTSLSGELRIIFKVRPEEFDELSTRDGFKPAPYLARNKWVLLEDVNAVNRKELQAYLKQSYEIIKAKLPKKAKL